MEIRRSIDYIYQSINYYYVDSIDLGDTEASDELLAGTEFDRFIQADELDR
jgi:hypothetical protein